MFFLWIVIICAAFLLWYLHRKIRNLDGDLTSVQDSLYRHRTELIERLDGLNKELVELRVDLRRRFDDLVVTKDTTLAEALTIHPKVQEVLAKFNIGGCSTCSLSDQETLEQAAASYGINVEEMIKAIEKMLEDPDGYEAGRTGEEVLETAEAEEEDQETDRPPAKGPRPEEPRLELEILDEGSGAAPTEPDEERQT